MGFLLIAFIIVMAVIFIIQKTENNRLSGELKRAHTELSFERLKNKELIDPLESIAAEEPLTALRLLRDHLEHISKL